MGLNGISIILYILELLEINGDNQKMITFIVGLFCMPVAVLMGTILSYKPSNINEAAARSGYKHGRRAAWNFQV